MNKLRQIALAQENRIAAQHPPISGSALSLASVTSSKVTTPSGAPSAATASLDAVRDVLLQTQKYQRSLVDDIEELTCTDEDLLLMKATSHSTVMALEHCFAVLQSILHHNR